MIQIKYRDGNTERVRLEVEVSEKAIYRKELMTEEYVLLTFDTAELVNFRKGDYIETEFGRFLIVELEKPKRNVDGNGGYSYEQKFHAPWVRWATRKLFYARQRGAEKAWSMTQRPEYFMQIVIDNLLAAGYGEFMADVDPELSEMKLVEFDGDDIVGGLNKIAEAWETEWWATDDVIHLGKCEYGTPVDFEEGGLIRSMSRSDGQANDYITRLYAFGSTRNIPTNYRRSDDDEAVIESVVERRLKLPEGTDHIDAWPNLREEDVVEGVAIFEDVYPRRTGKCEDITTVIYRDEVKDDDHPDGELVEWKAYRFKDSGITFKSEYILPDEELRLIFQSGALAGMDFAVVFNPDGLDESKPEAQVWEIVRNDTYGIDLPSDKFHPGEDDEYILYGYDTKMVSDILIPDAERELLEEAKKFLAKKCVDDSVYTCETDKIRCAGYTERGGELRHNSLDEIDLDVGQRVELRSDNYFSDTNGSRISRVRAFEKRLDNKFAATYEVGETATYSHSKELDEKMESLTVQSTRVTALGGAVYLIKRYDKTAPGDHNAYSSLRADAQFLHSDRDDRAAGKIGFDGGVEFGDAVPGVRGGFVDGSGAGELRSLVGRERLEAGEFFPGLSGAALWVDDDGLSHAEADVLHVRRKLTAKEVEIQKETHVGGSIISSPAGAVVTRVVERPTGWVLYFAGEDATGRRVGNEFAVWDQVRCQTFNLEREADGTVGNRYWWRLCTETGTVNSVYDERTGSRAVNYCAEPRPLGLQMTADGYFKTAAGGWTELTRVPQAGERVTVRLRGRFASAADGGAHIIDVWTGGNWGECIRLSGDEFEGGKAGETVSVSFDWPEASTEACLMLRTARRVDGAWLQDPDARLESVALMRGEGVDGEPVTEHFVEVSAEDCDAAGTSVPRAGDEIHTVGNRHIPSRRNAIFLTSYDAGAGVAPCLLCYSQISDYSLGEDNLTARLSPAGNFIRGEFKVLADGGVYKDVRDWARELDAAALLEMTKKLEQTQTSFKQTTDTIEGTVTRLTSDINGVTEEVASLKIEAGHISAQVSASSFEIPNLCTTPFVDAGVTADGYFKEGGQYFTLSDELQAGEQVAVRLRGRFAQRGVVELYLGSWSMGTSIAHGEDTFEGGRDDEDFVAVVKVPAGGVAGRLLVVRTRRWGSAGWEYDADCRLRYIAVVRGEVMPLAYRNEDSVAEALLPTGIDIRRGKVEVTADNFEVRNNAGETTALIDAQGKLTASLIDADKITARRVVAGDEKGQRVEIDPTLRSIEIYDGAGAQCTVLDGTAYADGPGDLGVFGGERAVAIGTVGSGSWTRTNGLSETVTTFRSGEWDCPAGTLRLSGSLTLTAVLSARTAGESDSAGHLVDIANETAGLSATLTLTVGGESYPLGDGSVQASYVAAGIGQAANYPAKTIVAEARLTTTPVTVTTAGKGRLTLELKNNSRCTADKYEVRADWRLSLRETVSQYVSRYFANGFLLGNSSTRYVSAWHGSDGLMHVEARNDGAGFRLTDGGVEMMAAEGVWTRVPVFLTRLFVEPQSDGTVKVYGAGAGVAGMPTAKLSGATVTLTYPAAWRSLGLTASNVIVNLTPSKEGGEAVLSGTSESGLTVSLRVNGAATPGHFYMELWRM